MKCSFTFRRLLRLASACVIVSGAVGAVFANDVHAAGSATSYYLSLGDSLAEGFQPNTPGGTETLHGYSNRVLADLSPQHALVLENFGCGGDTTTQMLYSLGCSAGNLANDGVTYPTTSQIAAAVSFIEAHPNQIGLITITIGGNDFGSVPSSTIQSNIESLAGQLRTAAGASVPIIGLGYYDDDLESWLDGRTGEKTAKESITQTSSTFDPLLESAYASANVTFLNIAADFGTFVPLTRVVSLSHHGKVPLAVFRICQLTWMCTSLQNVHPNDAGYSLIAKEIAQAYLKLIG